MRSPLPRLALPLMLLLAAAACSRSQPDAPPVQPQAPVAAAQPQGTEGTVGAPEAVPAPAPAVQPAPQGPVSPFPAPPAARPAPAPAPSPAPVAPPAADRGATRGAPVDAPAVAVEREAPRPAPVRMMSVPESTRLRLALQTAVASDTSNVEDRVSARVTEPVVVDGETVIPEGSRVEGRVTYAQPSGKVKGRAGLTVRFHTLTVGSRSYDIATEPFRREAEGTKAKDARNIGIGAGAGAVVGGILGGRKGAGIGAAVGGAGGTGVVLATRGAEVRLPVGTAISTRLADALVVEVRDRER